MPTEVPPGAERDAWLRRLSLLIKPASADCNLRCRYCFYRPKLALYPESRQHVMPREVLHRLLGEYMQMAGPSPCFGWQGGEPTVLGVDFFRRVVAVQMQKAQAGQSIANGLQTNGMLLDDEWGRFLHRYRFLVGVSLDGPPQVHDHYRRTPNGEGTHARVMRGIETLRRNQVEFNILCMVTDVSAGRAEEIWDFFMTHDLRYLQFIPCLEVNPRSGQLERYSCTPRAYGEFLCAAFDRWASEGFDRVYVRDFNDLLMYMVTGNMPSCVFRPTCGDYLLVEHNGDVYPCDFFVEPQWLLGNVMETPLRDIALSDRFLQFRNGKRAYGQGCQECRWLTQCHGGCQRHRLPHRPQRASHFCESYRMLFAHAESRLREMAKRVAPSDPPKYCR